MVNKIAFAAAFSLVFGILNAGPAHAATGGNACTNPQTATAAACEARKRVGVHGTVRPRRLPSYLPKNLLPENRDPLLYNLPHDFNPLDFPYNDNLRQDYPGLGLYR